MMQFKYLILSLQLHAVLLLFIPMLQGFSQLMMYRYQIKSQKNDVKMIHFANTIKKEDFLRIQDQMMQEKLKQVAKNESQKVQENKNSLKAHVMQKKQQEPSEPRKSILPINDKTEEVSQKIEKPKETIEEKQDNNPAVNSQISSQDQAVGSFKNNNETLEDTNVGRAEKKAFREISISDADIIKYSLQQCWIEFDYFSDKEAENIMIRFKIELDIDGNIIKQTAMHENLIPRKYQKIYQEMRNKANLSIIKCTPIVGLNKENYREWKEMEIAFKVENIN